jgi:predicted transcriptional regulator YheO
MRQLAQPFLQFERFIQGFLMVLAAFREIILHDLAPDDALLQLRLESASSSVRLPSLVISLLK